MSNRWTEEFLNEMASMSDVHADETLVEFERCWQETEAGLASKETKQTAIAHLFRNLNSNNATPPEDTFPMMHDFFVKSRIPLEGIDYARIDRGQEIFSTHLLEGALALLHKSLPEGYAAPNLSEVLSISDDLRVHPFKRLLGTLELVLNVSSVHGFEDGGASVIVAQKLRLLHAGVRRLVPRYRPDFVQKYGLPVNLEDMLATNIGFSMLVVEGLRKMGVPWTREQEEDYFYLWRVFTMMMGIHPPHEHQNWRYIPDSLDDARVFYEAYCRRHYVPPAENPHGVELAKANLDMLRSLVPRPMRWLGMGVLPRLYIRHLVPDPICEKIAIQPVRGHHVVKWVSMEAIKLASTLERKHEPAIAHLSTMLFQGLINVEYGKPVTFTIPESIDDMRGMVSAK